MRELHEIIKELRIKNNYSQNELAEMLCMTQQAYSKIENGTTLVGVYQLQKLAKLYKINIIEFFNNYSNEIQEIFDSKTNEINVLKDQLKLKDNEITILNKLIIMMRDNENKGK